MSEPELLSPDVSPKFIVTPFDGNREAMASIAGLHLQLRYWQREHGQSQFPGRIRDSQADLSSIDTHYIEPGGNFFVATSISDTVTVAGFIGLRKEDEQRARLQRLAVMPEYHRRGIGTLLVGAAVDWAIQAGFQRLVLSTGKDEHGRSIYERCGFVANGYDETYEHHDMELVLAAQF